MRDTERREAFHDAMIHTGPASLSREAAIGLALMGDKSAGPALVPNLTVSRFLVVRIGRIVALAHCGDARAVPPLLDLLASQREPSRIRAWAAAALGTIADKHPLPWNAGYAEDVVWWDAPTTLLDPDDGRGILDRW
jgi:HEAT repeat protein